MFVELRISFGNERDIFLFWKEKESILVWEKNLNNENNK